VEEDLSPPTTQGSSNSRVSKVLQFHDELLARVVPAASNNYYICGWSSPDSQLSRFSALLKAVDYNGGSVVDFGCGTGDLFTFLIQREQPFSYIGVDINERMIEVARSSHRATFRRVLPDSIDFPSADYVFASGVFQFVDLVNPTYYRDLLTLFLKKSRRGVAVNFLSSLRDESEKEPGELYLAPQEVTALASSLSGFWSLDHSYHPGRGDMTVGIRVVREEQAWRRPRV
jgi:SAM-dependent methyltransferase